MLKDNMYLNQWIQCDFSGEETFKEVCSKLSPKVRSIDDYCKFLQKVPNLCDLFSYKEVIVKKYFIVTMYMTLKGFRKFMSENYVSYMDNK